jgi:aminopeptidase N
MPIPARSIFTFAILLGTWGALARGSWVPVLPSDTTGCSRKTSAALARPTSSLHGYHSDIDATYYLLDLHLTPGSSLLSGRVLMRARARVDSLTTVFLDLSSALQIDSVRMGTLSLPITRYPQAFSVSLPVPRRQGETLELDITYHGTPATTGFGSFIFSSTTSGPWVWSLSEPYGARDWWPCNDHPGDKADSVDIWVTVPSPLKVGSNGRLMEVRENGDGTRTHKWAERYPIATYLVSVAVGPYIEFSNWYRYSSTDSMQVLNYVLPGLLSEAQANLPKTVDMLGIFSARFGAYPFLREKYGHSEFGTGGAMEHQTMTSTTTYDEDVIAHELAHQWFGDLITCASWRHLWLNEGFATYSEALYREARYGTAEYWRLVGARMASAFNAEGTLFVEDTSSVGSLFGVARVYAKGSIVLHMLRHVIGDSAFFRSLKAYVADPRLRYATATTEDFRQTCEKITGRDLGWFFAQWVYGERYPRYIVGWSSAAEGTRSRVTVTIDQQTRTTNPVNFVMPIDCRISSATRDTTVVLWNDRVSQEFTVSVGFTPTRVEVDPERWILREVSAASDPLPQAFVLEPNYPNPFNPSTTIVVRSPRRAAVTLAIYSPVGEKVRTLVDDRMEPGSHPYVWYGSSDAGLPVASGLYFCRLTVDGYAITQRLLLLR